MKFVFVGQQGTYPREVRDLNDPRKMLPHKMAGMAIENPSSINYFGVRFPLNVPVEVNEDLFCSDAPGERYSKVKLVDKLRANSHFVELDEEAVDSGDRTGAGSESGQSGAGYAQSAGAHAVQGEKRRGRPPKNLAEPTAA